MKTVDPLSDVLSIVRLSGAIFFDVDVSAPWSARSPPTRDLIEVLPEARHLMSYHIVTEGDVWAVVEGDPPLRMSAGTMIVFPHGDPHMVGSDPALGSGESIETYRLPLHLKRPHLIRGGGHGASRSKMICGFFGCDSKPFNPLLASLPSRIVVSATDAGAGDLGVFFRLAIAEANVKSPGGAAMLERLGELMLIEAIRRYMRDTGVAGASWFAGMADPNIGESIRAIHSAPTERWTLNALARLSGMSRSAFAAKFLSLVGTTPMAYLLGWRMQLAASRLAGGATVKSAAETAGYESEAAFSRAFRKATGVSPGQWRLSGV